MSSPFFSGFLFGLGVIASICFVVSIFGALSSNPKDDSDGPHGRSGVSVITDYKTGMQYLKAPGGGITPRMDSNGQQVREVRP